MITFLGFLVLLAGFAAFVISKIEKSNSRFPEWLKGIQKIHGTILITVGIILMLTKSLFFFADRGFNYLLVSPTGNMSAVMEQGIKWRGFAKIDKWQKFIDVKVIGEGIEIDEEEVEGIMKPIPLRFIDQVTAKGYVSTRFELPRDAESFINLAVKFRTMSNLVNNTIVPTVKEQLVNTAYMFAAQDYISGEAQSFRQAFEEQLKGGAYAVEKIERRDTVYSDIQDDDSRVIKEVQTSYEVNKVLENGIPKRIKHELSENKIIVSQVIVDNIELEATFKQRLEAQRDESAKRQLEQQKVETAKDAQQRIIAEGERDKAAERVAQEKEQVKALIAIETKLKQEETNKKLAAIALETERLNAQKKKVTADAEAYEISKKVQAGITPEVKLQMELDRDVKVAAEIAKINFPQTMIIGGDSKGGTPLESLIGAAMAKQLQTTKK
ncbi:SPFH domain-containing protein [Plebeiibacterium sediminum]|uniref:SPFH domain-containing protein n=1 Tax=Plebeiibacterium sediminum TaxID=2992112 RepID=A0AAE3M8C5_9BACT|nr:SPFH domain-containing protein [Plebeiobacterium sediminum]MCW3788739.1 SPFH domain-containing protein [Plebeiobacterium sediminum]